MAEAGEVPGIIMAEIDPDRVEEARRSVPSLTNARVYKPAGAAMREA